MLETSARLLRLLALLQARRFWTGAELAERLQVTPRTVRRDADKLRSLGYPVRSSSGVAGGYQLGAGSTLPPLLLEDDEALAVALGLRMATTGSVAGMEESAVGALAKLEQVLPARLRRRVRALHAAVSPLGLSGPLVQPEVLTTLGGACRGEQRARFRYRDREGRGSEREVEPHGLVCATGHWYLVGWDLQRQDWRTFRVDRIDARILTGQRFMPRPIPGGDLAAYVSRNIASAPYPVRARVVLHAPHARMAAKIPPLVARLEPLDEYRCLLEAGAQSPETLAYHLSMIGVEFEVLEPPELVAQVAAMAGRLTRAAVRGSRAP
ncbi:YafY family transcriptional regulator [Luteimonas sp. SJ-92]|uniref:YafY family transcriptional regulator n=1 Tax=Luteimonas salinisoli TaxID=2752307 RepID=A0A853JCQ9_9GAMM|nr:YafY family protein [Luteimonas salinisoli]NZA26409.1 YafY family transcriptional regulator [Luteimonas salinisoli]